MPCPLVAHQRHRLKSSGLFVWLLLVLCWPGLLHAGVDVDRDDDGLIEIYTVNDLDLVRYDPAGTSLNGESSGCPNTGCFGYELMNSIDLSFYYYWQPIAEFTGVFKGNGRPIIGLNSHAGGLFGSLGQGSEVSDLTFTNPSIDSFFNVGVLANKAVGASVTRVSVRDGRIESTNRCWHVGMLIGQAEQSQISASVVSGYILCAADGTTIIDPNKFSYALGGLIGSATNGTAIHGAFAQVSINDPATPYYRGSEAALMAVERSGGLVGELLESTITSSVADSDVISGSDIGGLAGYASDSEIHNSLVLGDTLRFVSMSGRKHAGGLIGRMSRVTLSNSLVLASNMEQVLVDGGLMFTGSIAGGDDDGTNSISEVYWDASLLNKTVYDSGSLSGTSGVSTADLKCPTTPGDAFCNQVLYSQWSSSVWDFGSSSEYPELKNVGLGASTEPFEWIDNDEDGIHDSTDRDDDNDGLIEIRNLTELDDIRNHLDGSALLDSSAGCPASGCNGFELAFRLDFDTNYDGVLDENDSYWNEGQGWLPIGSLDAPFTAIFDGNGYRIDNLMINRDGVANGLFGMAGGPGVSASIRNLTLSGALSHVDCGGNLCGALAGLGENLSVQAVDSSVDVHSTGTDVGGLVGSMANGGIADSSVNAVVEGGSQVGGLLGVSLFNNLYANRYSGALVQGERYVGGLVGLMENTSLSLGQVTSAAIEGGVNVGGITGLMAGSSRIADSQALVVRIAANTVAGGLVGNMAEGTLINSYALGHELTALDTTIVGGLTGVASGDASVINSYWNGETTGQLTDASGTTSSSTAEMTCPQQAGDACASQMYAQWSSADWNFGSSSEYPALVYLASGLDMSDADQDGVIAAMDALPNNASEWLDTDGDGVGDNADDSPSSGSSGGGSAFWVLFMMLGLATASRRQRA